MSATSSHPSTGTNTQDIDPSCLRWIVEGCKYFKESEELVVECCRAQGHGRADIHFDPWVVELRAFHLAFDHCLIGQIHQMCLTAVTLVIVTDTVIWGTSCQAFTSYFDYLYFVLLSFFCGTSIFIFLHAVKLATRKEGKSPFFPIHFVRGFDHEGIVYTPSRICPT